MKCSQCERQFKTPAALGQHVSAVHGAAKQRGPAQPRRKARIPGPITTGASRRENGLDAIIVKAVAKGSVAAVLLEYTLKPSSFAGSRFAKLGGMWARWRPVRMELVVVGDAPSTSGGLMCAAWLADPDKVIPTKGTPAVVDTDAMRRIMIAAQPNFTVPFYSTGRLVITRPAVQRWLLISDTADTADSCHGKIIVATLTPPTEVSNLLVELRWEVEVSEQAI